MAQTLLAEVSTGLLVLAVIAGIAGLAFLLVFLSFIKIWIQALFSGARVSFFDLIGMALRKVPAQLIVGQRISAVQAGITDLTTQELESVFLVRRDPSDVMICVTALIIAFKARLEVSFADLQAHHFSGGHLEQLVKAMVAAHRAGIPLTLDVARAIDLAGRDILDAVQTTVKPKIIDCPRQDAGVAMLDAVAKDGIRLLVKARVTVRSNIAQLVRGATEETIIARVGQGIVSAIGSSATYKDVLENPDRISRRVLDSGLDAQTAFEIVSIDIADVSVAGVGGKGEEEVSNVGAKLETERAEADKRLRQAEAEGRRAMAVAREQEMRALVVENEAKVPLAIAEAFKSGNLGIMDFYRIKNIGADTQMRESIAKPKKDTT
jgi:uncharacterized protein YqfA (UPF0365 family)